MDGTPTSRLNDWLLRSLAENKIPLGSPIPSPLASLPAVTPITFELPASTVTAIQTSITAHDELMGKHELAVLQYDGYGKDTIKQFKVSPDSYTQLVMALAYYKMKGVVAATYESAQTRKYKLGRTEVIRSATVEAVAWCKAMENPAKGDLERLQLLQAAAASHIKLAGEAADGQGVDRHLFGACLSTPRLVHADGGCRAQKASTRGREDAKHLHRGDVQQVLALAPIDESAHERVLRGLGLRRRCVRAVAKLGLTSLPSCRGRLRSCVRGERTQPALHNHEHEQGPGECPYVEPRSTSRLC